MEKSQIDPVLLNRLSNFLNDKYGLDFSTNLDEQKYVIANLMKGFRCQNLSNLINQITCEQLSIIKEQQLLRHVTIEYSSFFRDIKSFEIIESLVLNFLKKKKLKFLSCGCSLGQEPYSIAILLDRLLKDQSEMEVDIVGIDICKSYLEKAKSGCYSKFSLRNLNEEIKKKFFIDKGKFYQLKKYILKKVKFIELNLCEKQTSDKWKEIEGFDLILFRNVLIYLSYDKASLVINRLSNLLKKNAFLFVSQPEISLIKNSGLLKCESNGYFFFKNLEGRNGQ